MLLRRSSAPPSSESERSNWRINIMEANELAHMLREVLGQVRRVVDGSTPDLGIRAVGPELARYLELAIRALEAS